MKTVKILMTVLAACAAVFTVKAGDDAPIQVGQLPAKSQEFIRTHFKVTDVSYAKVDKELFDTTYEVLFVDGSKAEFDKNGDWKEVDCRRSNVPSGIVPAQITGFVEKSHSGSHIVKIDRDKRDYEVKLNNGIEIKFDLKFNLIGYDD